MNDTDIKFEFGVEFQWDLLRFTVQDKNGYRAVKNFTDGYFTLLEHSIIAHALKNYYKKEKRIPGSTILKEEIRYLLNSREFARVATKDDEEEVLRLVNKLYSDPVRDGDKILEKAVQFQSYVELKFIVENVDLKNFQEYDNFSRKIQKAIVDEDYIKENAGIMMMNGIKERQFKRQDDSPIVPTPFRQVNSLTNAGGFSKGSVLVLLDRPKKFKTGMLINIARSYLKQKKTVLYIDTENGEDELAIRLEQSIVKKNKKEILSGEYDDKVQRALKKYKRLGAEMVIKRVPALHANCNDIQSFIDEQYREYGIQFEILIVDYAAKLASISGKDDDFGRISDTYIDIANLADRNNIEHVWTAHHVVRSAEKRMATKYEGTDIAKCIDIVRHAQAIFGLNRTEEEEQAGYQRLEIVEQRDGKPYGKAVFVVDHDKQRADELSKKDRREYDNIFSTTGEAEDADYTESIKAHVKIGGDI
jgi:hypothetical protein